MLETAAMLAAATGDTANAETDYRRMLDIRAVAIGHDHPDTLDATLQLGLFLTRQGKAEGDALVQRAHQRWLARIPADSANGIRVRQGWAEWLLTKGRLDDAATTLAALQPVVASSPYAAINQQILQARLTESRDRTADAIALWQQVVASAEALYGKDSALTAQWENTLESARKRLPVGR
ncbi:hypothetical protein D3C81_1322480 [compost metagenome]